MVPDPPRWLDIPLAQRLHNADLGYFIYYYESINKAKAKDKIYGGVGVMKDYNLTLRNLPTSHTLSWSWNWNT
jgi:hypothetical protein